MTDRYVVIGHPISHSKSPIIQADFARQFDLDFQYCKLLSPLDGFAQTLRMLCSAGVKGANVTVPFKQQAWALSNSVSDGVRFAQAANTLKFAEGSIQAENTDGLGLCADLTRLLAEQGRTLQGANVVLVGAGGAASGCIMAFQQAGVDALLILNRTLNKAQDLAQRAQGVSLNAKALDLDGFDSEWLDTHLTPQAPLVLVNASSSSLSGQAAPIDPRWFQHATLAYDMMYGAQATPFMVQAQASNPRLQVADGLGMLVFQAAAAFEFWTGLQPRASDTLMRMRHTLHMKAGGA